MLALVFILLLSVAASQGQETSGDQLKVLEDFTKSKENLITDLATAAEKAYKERPIHVEECTCSRHSCTNIIGENAECLGRLRTLKQCGKCSGSILDYADSAVRVAPGTNPKNLTAQVRETICTFKSLNSKFVELGVETWTYVGSIDGTFRVFPIRIRIDNQETGEEYFQRCSTYDPRLRPWYISASTGPKDVVLLIDTSGSMAGPEKTPRWDLTRKALNTLLDTFTFGDYVNIVTFNSEAKSLVKVKGSPLLAGTEENMQMLKDALRKVVVNGGTDFNNGFNHAFDVLEEAAEEGPAEKTTSSSCTKIIIFLTDGRDCSTRDDAGDCSLTRAEGPEILLENIEERQAALEQKTNSRAAIFTFSMGKDADDSIPRQIACANQGTWSFFEDGDDPLLKLNSYYTFLAAARYPGRVAWAAPYEDSAGLGTLTTVSKPIYSPPGKNGTGGVQIGVVGHDVELSELEIAGISSSIILQELANPECVPAKLEPCRLQVQRDSSIDDATCPDRLPKKKCFEFRRRYYRRYNRPLDRDDAQAECVKRGGNLVSIRSDDHLAFIASLAAVRGSWVGAKRQRFSQNHQFKWVDESIPPIDETSDYWGTGEPHDEQQGGRALGGVFIPGEECAIIDPRGVKRNMNDALCDELFSYICEFEEKPSECRNKDTAQVDPRSFFEIPPLSQCRPEEDIVSKVRPVAKARTMDPETALCPLGKKIDFKEKVCCEQCPKATDFDIGKPGWPLKSA